MADEYQFELDFSEDSEAVLSRLTSPFAATDEDSLSVREGTVLYDMLSFPVDAFVNAHMDVNETLRQGFITTMTGDTLTAYAANIQQPRISAVGATVRVSVSSGVFTSFSAGTVFLSETNDGSDPVEFTSLQSASGTGSYTFDASVTAGAPNPKIGARLILASGAPHSRITSITVQSILTNAVLEEDDDTLRRRLIGYLSGARFTTSPEELREAIVDAFPGEVGDVRVGIGVDTYVTSSAEGVRPSFRRWGLANVVPVYPVPPNRYSVDQVFISRKRLAEMQKVVDPSVVHWLDPEATVAANVCGKTGGAGTLPTLSVNSGGRWPGGSTFVLTAPTGTSEMWAQISLPVGSSAAIPLRVGSISVLGDVFGGLAIGSFYVRTYSYSANDSNYAEWTFASIGSTFDHFTNTTVTVTGSLYDWKNVNRLRLFVKRSSTATVWTVNVYHILITGSPTLTDGLAPVGPGIALMPVYGAEVSNPLPTDATFTAAHRNYWANRDVQQLDWSTGEEYAVASQAGVTLDVPPPNDITLSSSMTNTPFDYSDARIIVPSGAA